MQFIEGCFYHICNRGNNQQKIFFTDANYLFFLHKVKKELLPYCDILSYCLMPNHFHLQIYAKTSNEINGINNGIAILLRSYTRAIQKQENFKGSLFQQKTKAKILDDNGLNSTMDQLSICMHYIHQNPVRAGLVEKMEDWPYSSFKEYINDYPGRYLCNTQMAFEVTGITPDQFFEESYQSIPERYLYWIRVDQTGI